MSRDKWLELKAHRQLHTVFVDHIRNFAKEYNAGAAGLSQEIVQFLRDWTINHILQEDGKFKIILHDKKRS